MRDDFSGLRALLCVAEKRSFTAAAAELRVTPSAVSQIVRALEGRVGVRLLQRTTRNVGLTEAGVHFIAQLEPAFHGIDVAFESLSALRGRPSGLLRLTMLRTGYSDVLKPKLACSWSVVMVKWPEMLAQGRCGRFRFITVSASQYAP